MNIVVPLKVSVTTMAVRGGVSFVERPMGNPIPHLKLKGDQASDQVGIQT